VSQAEPDVDLDEPEATWTPDDVDFDKNDGLVPCVTQHARLGRVLMVAYMTPEALETTLDTGQMHYYSRSRDELWHKGETSDNTQDLVAIAADCDRDTLLALVDPAGPACHTGETSCFFEKIDGDAVPVLPDLWRVIEDRAENLPEDSWTTQLLTQDGLVEEKLLEEAWEVVDRAGEDNGEDPLEHEIADLFYHALVLGKKHDVTLDDVLDELDQRHRG
jgi:phosphoribosyl-ATP pyrophosphohydrolase/phosphoribosyl-AMP cyclohydrolase